MMKERNQYVALIRKMAWRKPIRKVLRTIERTVPPKHWPGCISCAAMWWRDHRYQVVGPHHYLRTCLSRNNRLISRLLDKVDPACLEACVARELRKPDTPIRLFRFVCKKEMRNFARKHFHRVGLYWTVDPTYYEVLRGARCDETRSTEYVLCITIPAAAIKCLVHDGAFLISTTEIAAATDKAIYPTDSDEFKLEVLDQYDEKSSTS